MLRFFLYVLRYLGFGSLTILRDCHIGFDVLNYNVSRIVLLYVVVAMPAYFAAQFIVRWRAILFFHVGGWFIPYIRGFPRLPIFTPKGVLGSYVVVPQYVIIN